MIGAAVGLGSWITGGIATGVAAGMIGGAIIGAAIGGITAAVTGGSIGKGMLFGAIGGAVTGGLGAWAQGGQVGVQLTAAGGETVQTVGGSASASLQAAENAMLNGVSSAGGGVVEVGTAASGLSVGELGSGAITSSLIDAGGKMLAGSAEQDMAQESLEASQEQLDKQLALQEKLAMMTDATTNAASERNAAVTLAGQDKNYDIANKQIEETKRQFDTGTRLDAESLARQQSAVTNAKAARQGVLKGGTSIDSQVTSQEKELVA